MSSLNLERGFTRCYMVLWALWLAFLVFRSFVVLALGGWPIKVVFIVLLGVLIPGVLLLACRWAVRGFRPESQ